MPRSGAGPLTRVDVAAVLISAEPAHDAAWQRARADLDSAVAAVFADLLVKWHRADEASRPGDAPTLPGRAVHISPATAAVSDARG